MKKILKNLASLFLGISLIGGLLGIFIISIILGFIIWNAGGPLNYFCAVVIWLFILGAVLTLLS